MKKYLLSLAVLLAGAASFTSCNDDEGPSYVYQTYSNGAYIVNAGNMYSNIDGSLTYINYANNNATQKAFSNANNGESLGSTPNDGLVYGGKIYIAVDQSNTIEVLDKKTLKRIKQIKTTELVGTSEGAEPRHIFAGDGKIFFTTYGGYVAAVDTTNYTLYKSYQVGAYPEGLVGSGSYIYVANSNYGYGNGTISLINYETGEVTTNSVTNINNPQKFFIANNQMFVLDWPYYDTSYASHGEAAIWQVSNGVAYKVINAYYADQYNGKFYYISDPYGTPSYGIYEIATGNKTTLDFASDIQSPAGISVDPVTGHIFVFSYVMGEYGYADYSADGYVVEYDNNGTKLRQYATGVGPTSMFFDAGYSLVEQ